MRNVCTRCEQGFPLEEGDPGVLSEDGMNVHEACDDPAPEEA